MNHQPEPINPHLADLFDTALAKVASPTKAPEDAPKIVVHGNHNVLAWGGTVYVGGAAPRLRQQQPD